MLNVHAHERSKWQQKRFDKELCKKFPDKVTESPSKFSAAHPKIAIRSKISASHSQNLAGMLFN